MGQIIGTEGKDNLLGTPENDTLNGLNEADTLTGGAGADIFVLRADPKPGENDFFEDTITDFTIAQDDVFLLPLVNGTQVRFDMLRLEFENEGGITGTTIEVPFNGEFEEIALVTNLTPDQLNNSALFIP